VITLAAFTARRRGGILVSETEQALAILGEGGRPRGHA
jgi:hypothetical protein